MDSIYIVTTVHIGDPMWQWGVLCIERKRPVGWFPTVEDAIWAVVSNGGDIHEEGYYDHCVIEKVSFGLYPGIGREEGKEKWFKWSKGAYSPTDKPEGLAKVINFSIG